MGTFCQTPSFDNTPPTIENCPSNIRLTSQFGGLVVASWITPTVSDNSGFVELLFLSHMSLSQFPVGDTAVSYIYVDPSNNQAACTFIVTVEGPGAPSYIVITRCPGDIVIRTTTGQGTAVWTDPVATSINGPLTSRQSHFSGSQFNFGTTLVSYTFTDNQGNQASCVFSVTVELDTGITVRSCPAEVRVTTTDPSGGVIATWTEPTASSPNSNVVTTATHEPGDTFSVGSTTVTYRFIDNLGNSETCSFQVIVTVAVDAIQIFNCPEDITQPSSVGGVTEFIWTPPTGQDRFNNVIVPTVNRNPPVFLGPGEQLEIVYTFRFGSDVATCMFTLTVRPIDRDTTPPTVVSQPNTIVQTLPLGQDTVTVTWMEPVVTDDSGLVVLIDQSHMSGISLFGVGTTRVSYTYIDGSGNIRVVEFNVIINRRGDGDTNPPVVINVPQPITLTLGPNEPAVVRWNELIAVDDQSAARIVSRSHVPGDVFPDGITLVEYTFADAAGNTVTVSFTVTIIRVTGQPTVQNCPANIQQSVPSGVSRDIVLWTEPSVINLANTIPVQTTQSHRPGDSFPLGSTRVTYLFDILEVLQLECTFTVTISVIVSDVIQVSNCPGNVIEQLPAMATFMAVSWNAPTAVLNNIELTPTEQPPSSQGFFPAGNQTITYRWESGILQAECTFLIIIQPSSSVMNKRDVQFERDYGLEVTLNHGLCGNKTCLNGGTCLVHIEKDSMYSYCKCPEGWQGVTCTEHAAELFSEDLSWSIIVPVACVFAVLLLFLFVCQLKWLARQQASRADEKAIIQ